jgi:transcriptional regulator with XRE-family HTH domain
LTSFGKSSAKNGGSRHGEEAAAPPSRYIRAVLSEDEAKRRIAAARLLRGLTQEELDGMGAADGLGRQELSRTERGELPVTRVRREVLARLLNFPVEWFMQDSIEDLIRWPAEELAPDQVKRAAELLAPQLLEAARALQQASGSSAPKQGAPDLRGVGGEDAR